MPKTIKLLLLTTLIFGCAQRAADEDSQQQNTVLSKSDIKIVNESIVAIDDMPIARMEDHMDDALTLAVSQYESGKRQQALGVFADYARKDNPVALNYMGHYAITNLAGIQDQDLALTYYNRAALLGYAPAQHNLGVLLGGEDATQEELEEAVDWFSLAAEQNYGPSLYNLGVRRVRGLGTDVNFQDAVNDFQRAAQVGIREARYNLALVYSLQESATYDPKRCYIWATVAMENFSQVEPILRDCSARLTDTQRIEAVNEIASLRIGLDAKK